MGKTEKNRKENHATKVTKIPKTKRRKYGMNKTVEMKIKMIIVQAVQMINPNEVLDSIDFKLSLILFYYPVLHFAV